MLTTIVILAAVVSALAAALWALWMAYVAQGVALAETQRDRDWFRGQMVARWGEDKSRPEAAESVKDAA